MRRRFPWLPPKEVLRLCPAGFFAVLGVLGLVSFAKGGVPSVASEPAAGQTMPATTSWTAPTSSTHTLFLPLTFRTYWQAPESPFGVQMYADHREQEVVVRVRDGGARWARVPLFWSQVEPQNTTPEQYQWPGELDDWLARLAGQNIRLILTVTGNPPWATAHTGGPITDPEILNELVEFVAAAVAHYSGPPYNVKHWEFYNEPDNGDEFYADYGWGYWGYEPAAYAAMLKSVYLPLKAVDPEAQIVFGGLAYDWFTTAGGPFVEGFLDGVLLNGGGAYFDVMNFHYYPAFRSRWDPYGLGVIGKATYLRNKLAQYGVYKPFICTETGIVSDAAHHGSHELQSRSVPQLFAQSMAANLQLTIWFTLVDDGTLGMPKWGLLNADLSPKPAYYAYQTAAQQVATASYVEPLNTADTGSPEIEAYKFWTLSGSSGASGEGPTWIIVAWTNDELEHSMALATANLVRVDKFGAQTFISDGDDGAADGRVHVTVGPSPVYLRFSAGRAN